MRVTSKMTTVMVDVSDQEFILMYEGSFRPNTLECVFVGTELVMSKLHGVRSWRAGDPSGENSGWINPVEGHNEMRQIPEWIAEAIELARQGAL